MADLFDTVEDAENAQQVADPATTLTDAELEAGGLRQVKAFVRTKASSNALRVRKHREKAEAQGMGQVNVVAPAEARDTIKAIAKRTAGGESLDAVLRDLVGVVPPVVVRLPESEAKIIKAARESGWRGRLIRWLAR